MTDKTLLELEPTLGDVYWIDYLAASSISSQRTGTTKLKTYFRSRSEFDLLQVKTDGSNYQVKVQIAENIKNASGLFEVEGFSFNKLEETESVFQKIISTLVGIFMGG